MKSPLATVDNLRSLTLAIAAMRRAKTPDEKLKALEAGLSEIVERISPDMTKKLTTAIATDMVNRIEALQNQIDAIYTEANTNYDGMGNSNVIRDAVKARAELRDAEFRSSDLLASFDIEDAA